MIIEEISIQRNIDRFSQIAPYTFSYIVNVRELASFWTDIFLAQDESTSESSIVLNCIANYISTLNHVDSKEECIATFETWSYNSSIQTLYINVGIDFNPLYDIFEYMRAKGFCDTDVVYIDDIEYLPLIKSAPAITAQQDLINYSKLAMTSGDTQLVNANRELDYMKSTPLFSNDVRQYFLNYDGRQEYTRTELVPVSSLLVNNVTVSKGSASLELIDPRSSMNKKVPIDTFTSTAYPNASDNVIGEVIPLMFGTVNRVKAICTNGETESGVVTFRIATSITAIGTVQVKIGDAWTTVIPDSVSLSTGEFTLSESNGRDSGTIRECRVNSPTGIAITNVADIIVYLDELANGIPYTSSFYNITEWVTETAMLGTVGVYIKKEIELYEIIRRLQEGSNNRFRYEYNSNGLRTLRLDNPSRTSSLYVPWVDIFDNEVNVYTDRDTIAAFIKIKYFEDYFDESYLSVTDSSAETAITQYARDKPTIEFETYITNKTDADARAALEASRLGQIRKFTDVTFVGKQYLTLRIYDIITVELYDDTNEWFGVWECQVLRIAPDISKQKNKVKLLLVEQISVIDYNRKIKIGDTGDIKIGETNKIKVGTI